MDDSDILQCGLKSVFPKLARWSTMLIMDEEYTDQGQDYYKERYRERMLKFVATK